MRYVLVCQRSRFGKRDSSPCFTYACLLIARDSRKTATKISQTGNVTLSISHK